jgi:predicted nucleic acid-binding protein
LKLLLDTNVVSEPANIRPNPKVVAWLSRQDPLEVHISVVTLAEIEEGIARLPPSRRRAQLEPWRDALLASIGERLVAVDEPVASAWGALRARLAAERRSIAPLDGFVAATAEVHGMTVVTRNTRHFQAWGGPVFNPWVDA